MYSDLTGRTRLPPLKILLKPSGLSGTVEQYRTNWEVETIWLWFGRQVTLRFIETKKRINWPEKA